MPCSLSFLHLVFFVFCVPRGPPFGPSGILRGLPSAPRLWLPDLSRLVAHPPLRAPSSPPCDLFFFFPLLLMLVAVVISAFLSFPRPFSCARAC